jgi:hypothetical protein
MCSKRGQDVCLHEGYSLRPQTFETSKNAWILEDWIPIKKLWHRLEQSNNPLGLAFALNKKNQA